MQSPSNEEHQVTWGTELKMELGWRSRTSRALEDFALCPEAGEDLEDLQAGQWPDGIEVCILHK